ncbi:MAG: hypothetical protein KKA62_04600 [Nanoarchaeota archaeon]|nr:hypothetical protein [Nanoarchaeota archaeon]MBU1643888.1 hypothetical protein [Nanoarchaeota archaeon]MBU1977201.1 hypothetical protein [Nanoarchaeota archaeon]
MGVKKIKRAVFLLGIIVFSLFLISCSNSSKPSKVLAEINGNSLTLDEFNQEYYLFGNQREKYLFLNDVVIPNEILLSEAQRQGLEASEKEIESALNVFLEKVNMEKKDFFEKVKKEQGLSKSDINRLMEKKVLISKIVKDIIPSEIVTEEEIEKTYQDNIKSFEVEGEVLPLEKVKDKIEDMLMKVNKEKAVREYVMELAEKGNVVVHTEFSTLS